MQLLKDNIHSLILERKSLMEQVYEGSKFFSMVAVGINKTFNVLAAFLSSFSAVPLIGSFFQTLAAIPEGIAYFSDPKRSFKEKMLAVLGIAVVAIAAVALFALGAAGILTVSATTMLILSSVIALAFAIGEGINAVSKIIASSKASTIYDSKKEFLHLLKTGNLPDNDTFNELLEIRVIELQHEIDKPGVRNQLRREMNDELHFIEKELNKRNIIAGKEQNRKAFELLQLYAIHKEQIEALAMALSLITEETDLEANQEVLDEIQKLQGEILTTEEDITNITQPIDLLQFEKETAAPRVAFSLTAFATTSASAIISVIALLLGMGVLVAPPVLLPISISIGITLAIIGLGRWVAEKMADQKEKAYKLQSESYKKDIILNEALIAYEQTNNINNAVPLEAKDLSHTKHMSELLSRSKPDAIEPVHHKDEFTLLSRKKADTKAESIPVDMLPDTPDTPALIPAR